MWNQRWNNVFHVILNFNSHSEVKYCIISDYEYEISHIVLNVNLYLKANKQIDSTNMHGKLYYLH